MALDDIHILLVEDETKLALSLKRQLSRAGYSVELAFDGQSAQNMLDSQTFDLVVLDLNLPKKSGFEVLHEMREQSSDIPVLILSARGKTEDRVRGLKSGADDYLSKPFDPAELIARIEALLRRVGYSHGNILRTGDLILDVVKRKVTREDREIILSPKEFALLEFFMRNKNQILTRKRIAEQVWGYRFDTGTNIVNVYVNYLRKSINTGFSKKLIDTIHGKGFTLKDE